MSVRDTVPLRLRQAYVALNKTLAMHVGEKGVTGEQYAVIRVVGELGSLTQRELGGFIASDPSTVVAMLRLLERKGIVHREPEANDGRVRRVWLTRKGRLVRLRVYSNRGVEVSPRPALSGL